MREILFRGKREDNGEWVYGYYVKLPDAAGSVCFMHVPADNPDDHNTVHYLVLETVGQYTGLTDKDGNKIFEGDLLLVPFDDKPLEIKFEDGIFEAERVGSQDWLFMWEAALGKVIGNVYDNPELIGGDE